MRSYLSNNAANAEASRPTLVATVEKPAVVNKTTGDGYASLNAAFDALTGDAQLEISQDVKLTARCTLKEAYNVSITASADVTITGPANAMWFLVNKANGVLNIGSAEHKITLDGAGQTMTIDAAVIQRENSGLLNVTNVEFKNFDLGEKARLIGDKQQAGVITLQDITVTNCTNPKGGYIYCLRVANDALVLKGYLNIDEASTGTSIYKQANLKSDSSTEGRIKIAKTDDETEFTASKTVTIDWVGLDGKEVMKEGALVLIGTSGANAPLFKLLSSEWWLARKASNGDMYVTKVDPAPTTGIDELETVEQKANLGVYDLQGRQIDGSRFKVQGSRMAAGIYIVNGKKMVVK